ncbi:MAG: Crp/Fnr family transcriptional regulator [Acidobacteriota bacterium]|jgi:CRP-like cAMP-binding protein
MAIDELLQRVPLFRPLGDEDRRRLAELADRRLFNKGEALFHEGDPSDELFVVVQGRVKVHKITPSGRDVILEIFGAGDPIGAVAVYEEQPYPASATAITDCVCLAFASVGFFALLAESPTLVRGLLIGLTWRLMELTNRLTDLTGGKIEPRMARLFVKLMEDRGRPEGDGVFIPLTLSRQELADLTGTTIETCIRIMSRWGKEHMVLTEEEGFRVLDPEALEVLATS